MAGAGVAWGIYSLLGRGVAAPAATTAKNFALATPAAALVFVLFARSAHADAHGAALALASGAVTSGLGYVAWYAALRGLTATSASIVQLAVPILAAFGGVVLLDERPSLRLGVAATLTLGGVALATVRRPPGR
jgi:drug/metabolite transporter (DMT)-like permease